jgi:hypothetical protein
LLVIGDLNAYRNERPISTLRADGYVDLARQFLGDTAYSYRFDGQLGYLDHALADSSLATQVAGVVEWHINADEPVLFDYNDDVKDVGEAVFERRSSARPLFAPDPAALQRPRPRRRRPDLGSPQSDADAVPLQVLAVNDFHGPPGGGQQRSRRSAPGRRRQHPARPTAREHRVRLRRG